MILCCQNSEILFCAILFYREVRGQGLVLAMLNITQGHMKSLVFTTQSLWQFLSSLCQGAEVIVSIHAFVSLESEWPDWHGNCCAHLSCQEEVIYWSGWPCHISSSSIRQYQVKPVSFLIRESWTKDTKWGVCIFVSRNIRKNVFCFSLPFIVSVFAFLCFYPHYVTIKASLRSSNSLSSPSVLELLAQLCTVLSDITDVVGKYGFADAELMWQVSIIEFHCQQCCNPWESIHCELWYLTLLEYPEGLHLNV